MKPEDDEKEIEVSEDKPKAAEEAAAADAAPPRSGGKAIHVSKSDVPKPRFTPKRALILLAIVVVGVTLSVFFAREKDVYASWQSPDGQHTVTVYRIARMFSMPGGGSDAPGMILLTNADGTVLNRRKIGMVQLASEPEWGEGSVTMKLMFEWPIE